MTTPILGTLEAIDMTSGVNEAHEGFITVRATGEHNGQPVVLLGQVPPSVAREHAHGYLEAAEAAETDALLVTMFTELDMPPAVVGQFLLDLRNRRGAP